MEEDLLLLKGLKLSSMVDLYKFGEGAVGKGREVLFIGGVLMHALGRQPDLLEVVDQISGTTLQHKQYFILR